MKGDQKLAPTLSLVVLSLLTLGASVGVAARSERRPPVIIVGAGMSGISAAKTLSEAGIKNILILEATNRMGGRMRKTQFAGLNVEMGANWVEGVNGQEVNPMWTMAKKLKLRTFFSDYGNLSSNVYQETHGLYDPSVAQEAIDRADNDTEAAAEFTRTLAPSGLDDISVLTFQRLRQHVPSTPLDMVIDYYGHDYEFAEPPRVTSLQNTEPLPTFANFGDDVYFVADPRGYESMVYALAHQFLATDAKGTITDPRLKLNKDDGAFKLIVQHVRPHHWHPQHAAVYDPQIEAVVSNDEGDKDDSEGDGSGIFSRGEADKLFQNWCNRQNRDGSTYASSYVMVSASVGVLQTELIKFQPDLPTWKILAIYQFNMAVYTKIFLKFPYKFWPTGNGTEFFLYASDRRGYYPVWQQLESQYPGANVLLVTVTDEDSRRIEQQPDNVTKAEAMQVLRDMFGKNIPDATDILVPKWWSDRFYKGTFSNWPIGVSRYEYDQIRAPVGRVYFTGEHTSQHYNGYVHGAYLSGIDSAYMLIGCIKDGSCDVQIDPKA